MVNVLIFSLVLTLATNCCIAGEVDCCTVCSCEFDSQRLTTAVNCHNKGLSSVPANIPFNTDYLDLSSNKLSTVQNHSFSSLNSLRFLNLATNKISRLENSAFVGLDSLLVLRLSENNLLMNYTAYPETVFVHLSRLQELYIEDNFDEMVGEYVDAIFKPLQNLKTLQMDTFQHATFGEGFSRLNQLRRLQLGGRIIRCSMLILKNNTFYGFHSVPLEELIMIHCLLHHIETGSFQFFPYLSVLKIPGNKIGVKNVLRSLSSFRNRNMTEINISRVRFNDHKSDVVRIDDSVLTTDVIKYLASICVTKIDFSQNRLMFIDIKLLVDERFLFRKCIQFIDLSYNRLDQNIFMLMINIQKLSNLRFLNISHQFQKYASGIQNQLDLTSVEKEYLSDIDRDIISFQDHSDQYIQQGVHYFIILPSKLELLYMGITGQMVGSVKHNITIIGGSNLRELDLSHMGLREFEGTIKGLETLQKLDISGNDGTSFSETFFDSYPSLEYLCLNDMSIENEFFFWHGQRLFKKLVKLKTLKFAHNNLDLLSDDTFVNNINLEYLDLSYNRFLSLPVGIINLRTLTSIVMVYNSISYLNKNERDALDIKAISNPMNVYLAGNMFACGCENRDSVEWFFETNVVLDNKGNYSCISEHGSVITTSAMIDQIDLLFRTCSGKFWLFCAVCGLTLMLATFLSAMLITRLKTRIIYWIFKVLGHDVDIPKRTDFKYDLFVIHADSEYQWPCHTMRQNLEDDCQRNIRLCLKERNILPGGAKAEDIVQCLYSSWKSAIILTPEFVTDEWCLFALRTAIYSVSSKMPSRVIVLWEENVTVQMVPEELISVLDERSIIRFSWQMDPDDRFWQDLYKMIID